MEDGGKAGIWLVNPPSPAGFVANREGSGGMGALAPAGGFCYPPQTLAYVLAALARAGQAAYAVDAVGEGLDETATLQRIPVNARGSLVWVSWPTLEHDLAFVCALRVTHPDLPVILLGAVLRHPLAAGSLPPSFVFRLPSFYVWQYALQATDATAALLAEPDWPAVLLPLAQALGQGEDVKTLLTCPGLAFRQGDSWTVNAPPLPEWDFSDLPLPAWDQLPHAHYPFLTLFASRGCAESCSYCPYVLGQGTANRRRTPEAVLEELAHLVRCYPRDRYLFRDPVFASDRAWVMAFCRLLRQQRLRVHWECETRPDHLDAELLGVMQRAGCSMLKIGLETSEPETLARIHRLRANQRTQEYCNQVAQVVQACREIGLACRVFVLTGQPGETRHSLEATLKFLQTVRPTLISVKRFQAYPGLRTQGLAPSTISEGELRQFERLLAETAKPLPPPTPPSLVRRGWRWLYRHLPS